jgi:hypothetical protein
MQIVRLMLHNKGTAAIDERVVAVEGERFENAESKQAIGTLINLLVGSVT